MVRRADESRMVHLRLSLKAIAILKKECQRQQRTMGIVVERMLLAKRGETHE